ncbi:hypothetical protein L2719_09720 [Shewanella schlegeliana]|uniref:Porin n=1 Tax=Shewanella schlegeliana TaxID=190308 RepID=A0ABS1SVX8_9GAMM|nr:hypothetical protein [Shewanella schlegeliana]MBL4912668.1 hypothetical protein [Shewanella schlegeliana]MCL1109822.1 hypothetical protein [Shewanella schlegeliana]
MNNQSQLFIAVLGIVGSGLAANAQATDWRVAFGAHDTIVDQADSHTLGAHAGFYAAHKTQSDLLWQGEIDIFIDDDKDKLDPDHIPIWFQSAFSVDGNLYRFSEVMNLQWQVTLEGKRNTVSSIEKQAKLFPGIVARYDSDRVYAGFEVAAGYYMLEIDDDVPRERGYDREDFQNKTTAYSVAFDTRLPLGDSFDIYAKAQTWNDGSDWLENKISGIVSYRLDGWIEDSKIQLSVEHSEYNLDPYDNRDKNSPDYLAILPWDRDTLVRIYVDMPWG